MPPKTPKVVSHQFSLVRVALLVVAVHAALVLLVPPNPVRSGTAILASAAAGYALLAVVAGRTFHPTDAEVVAYSVGAAILVTSLSAIGASVVSVPIGDAVVIPAGLLLTVLAVVIHPTPAPSLSSVTESIRSAFSRPGDSRGAKAVERALLVAAFLVTAALVLLFLVPFPNPLTPGMALVGPDGSPLSLPSAVGPGDTVDLTVSVFGGDVDGSFELRLLFLPQNATGNETTNAIVWGTSMTLDAFAEARTNVSLPADGRVDVALALTLSDPGDYEIRFDLLDGPAIVAQTRLPIVVG